MPKPVSEEELDRLERGMQDFLGQHNDTGTQLAQLLRVDAPPAMFQPNQLGIHLLQGDSCMASLLGCRPHLCGPKEPTSADLLSPLARFQHGVTYIAYDGDEGSTELHREGYLTEQCNGCGERHSWKSGARAASFHFHTDPGMVCYFATPIRTRGTLNLAKNKCLDSDYDEDPRWMNLKVSGHVRLSHLDGLYHLNQGMQSRTCLISRRVLPRPPPPRGGPPFQKTKTFAPQTIFCRQSPWKQARNSVHACWLPKLAPVQPSNAD